MISLIDWIKKLYLKCFFHIQIGSSAVLRLWRVLLVKKEDKVA